MSNFLRRVGEAVLFRYYLFLYELYAGGVILGTALFVYLSPGFWYLAPLAPVVAFFFFELCFRIFLRLFYGKEYRYAIFLYFLVDDPRYGRALRPNSDSRTLNFRIYDSFIFPYRSNRILDLEENKRKRNIFTVNSLGFRGKEFVPHKKAAKLRIFCVGGSTTACDGNDDGEAWPAQLEKNLKTQGYDCEVINAGVPSWSSYKNYLRIRDEIATYNADVILLHEGLNEENAFSELVLAGKWRPGLIRNTREHMLSTRGDRFLTSGRFISKLLLIREIRLKLFTGKLWLPYEHPGHWKFLMRPEYLVELFENLIADARVAAEKNLLLYTIDFPTLVAMDDTPVERSLSEKYVRLSPLAADYDAVLKARIDETLALTSSIVTPLLVKQDMASYRGEDRLPLFRDSIHLSPKGNALLADAICARLIADPAFKRRYTEGDVASNVRIDAALVQEAREKAGWNSPLLRRYIEGVIRRLEKDKTAAGGTIPEDRYTTF